MHRCPIAPLGPDRAPIAPSGPDRAPIAPSGPDRAPIAPSGPDRAPIAPSGPDQGEIALSLVALLYKAASSATPAVRMVLGRSACGAVGDIARAFFYILSVLRKPSFRHVHSARNEQENISPNSKIASADSELVFAEAINTARLPNGKCARSSYCCMGLSDS